MERESTITSFMVLSGLRRANVVTLFDELGGDVPDFHQALIKAGEKGFLPPQNASSAIMSHLTGLPRSRTEKLLEGCVVPWDINQAIIQAFEDDFIATRFDAKIARMRALTSLSKPKAEEFLRNTKPIGYLEEAISAARDSGAISTEVAAVALFKVLTGFSTQLSKKLLSDDGVEWNVQMALEKGAKHFETPFQLATARLRAVYSLPEQDAKNYLIRRNVDGNYREATRQILVDQVMGQVTVDNQDAYKILSEVDGNVEKAVQVVRERHLQQPFYGGENADTRNPPDVHHNTHIISVLGVSDLGRQRRASPRVDGWMVSDFYLWLQVLRGMGRTQTWLTCENPYALVQNYGSEDKSLPWTNDNNELEESQISWKEGYIHGDPFEERVVVLNKENVKEAAQRVILEQRGRALRDRFLTEVERVCKKAESVGEPVLLMAFCHGDDGDGEMGGLCIGTDPGSMDADDFLSQKTLAKSLSKTPKVKVSLYLTSCYSGNWVTTPNFRLINPILTPTVMAAAQPDQESWAWEISCSQRHAGGVYTSAFLKELQCEPTELPEDATTDEARNYRDLCQDIIGEASRLCLRVTGSRPMFTPDGGHDKFWKRTGIPLAAYKRNYDGLKRVPASDANPIKDTKRPLDEITTEEISAWEARHPEEARLEFGSRTGGYGRTTRGTQSSLEYLANQYIRSHPGPRNMPANTALHNDLELFLRRPWTYSYEDIERIRSQVLYRTWAMRSANSYREWLNLNKIPPIEEWDLANPGKDFPQLKDNLAMIRGSGLFQRPDAGHGYWGQRWEKPFYYLAYAFAASGYVPRDIPRLLSSLKGYNQKITLRKKSYYLTLPSSKKSVRQMSEIIESTWKKSATKRKRRSLEDAGLMPRPSELTVSRGNW